MSRVIIAFDDFLLHQSESNQGQQNQLVLFKQSSTDPLEYHVSNVLSQFFDSCVILYSGLVDSFVEEIVETFQTVLVHRTYYVEFGQQEVQQTSFISYWSIDFSGLVDLNISFSSFDRLFFDFNSSSFGAI